MCCDIIMLIFGIIALIRGRFLLTRAKEVRGTPARMIGLVLVLPFPLSFLLGLLLGLVLVATGKPVNEDELKGAAIVIGVVVKVGCLLTAIGIAFVFAKPVRKYPAREDVEALDIPDRYDDHFESERRDRERDLSDSPNVTDRPPRSAPPDDRIQH